jgi:hypothetical protein
MNLEKLILIFFICFSTLVKGAGKDSLPKEPMYGECTHPGKYEPIGVLASCCTGPGDWTFSYSCMDMSDKGTKQGVFQQNDAQIWQGRYLVSPQKMSMMDNMLMGMYGISSRFSAMAMLNYNINNMTMNAMPEAVMNAMTGMPRGKINIPTTSATSGLGDSKLVLFYKLRQECRYNIIIGAGLNIPTGTITADGLTILGNERRLDYPMQLGTGSWDLMPSITFFGQRNVTESNILSYGAEAKADITPANNAQGYSYGNQYSLNAWVAYKFINRASGSVRFLGTRQGAITDFDPAIYPEMYYDPMANPANFGGTVVSAYVGFNFYLTNRTFRNLRFLAEYGIPVYQNLNGTQMSLQNTIQAGCKYSF